MFKNTAVNGVQFTQEQWLKIRKEEGLRINPDTAMVTWKYAMVLDPYGAGLEIPDEYRLVGREHFARDPRSEIWIHFNDLPSGTVKKLYKLHGIYSGSISKETFA